jgi:uncharacterized protein with GYD domain
MATYLLFGKYSQDGIKGMSAERTQKAYAVVENFGGKVKAGYALLGPTDLVLIIDFAGTGQAMQASAALSKLTGISFTTAPAVTVNEFDALMAET